MVVEFKESRTLSSAKAVSLGLSIAGVLFMIISGVALTLMILRLFQSRFEPFPFDAPEFIANDPARLSSAKMDWLMSQYGAPLTMFIASIMASSIGYFLLKAAGAATRETIPHQDAELLTRILTEKNEEALRGYIELASLTGFTGFFTKVGLSGLPLATIALTMFFAVLGIIVTTNSANLFDLAKLTLGAFIGSFVQRQVADVSRNLPGVRRSIRAVTGRSDDS